MRRSLSALLAAVLTAQPIAAQEKRAGEVRATVEVVVLSLDVTVLDKKERPVLDLLPSEFEVKVGGKPQPLEFFEPPAGAPAALNPSSSPAAARPADANPELVAGTTQPLQGDGKPKLRLLFYFDLEGLPSTSFKEASQSVRSLLDSASGSPLVSLVTYLGGASQVLWDERSTERIASELDRLGDLETLGLERSAVVSGRGEGQPAVAGGNARSWDQRRLLERSIIQSVVDAELLCRANSEAVVRALRDAEAYIRIERQRVRDAVAELRRICEGFAEGAGRRNVILLSEGFERAPGQNFTELLRVARESAQASCRNQAQPLPSSSVRPSFSSPLGMPLTTLTDLHDLERWLAASGVTLHFANPIRGGGFASAESPSYEINRNFRGEQRSLEDGVGPLVEATGGFFRPGGAELGVTLAPVLDAAKATYRIGVRLQNVRVDQPYKVVVSVKRKGLSVRHQSSFVPKAPEKSAAKAEIQTAERALADAHQDDRRPGAVRLSLPPLGVKLVWKGKIHADERKPGQNVYRVEIVVPYEDLKFLPQEDALIANVRLSLKAEATGTTVGTDEADLDVSPSFTGEEYRFVRDQSLVRPVLLSLRPGTYRLTATANDLIEERSGLARLEVTAEQ